MEYGALYAEQVMTEFESRFATPEFSNRVSFLSGLKSKIRRRTRISGREAAALRSRIEGSILPL